MKRFIPHLTIILSVMTLVFFVIDRFNEIMAFMTSELSKWVFALLALCGTALGSFSGFKLTSYRVEQLEKKVDQHNHFAERMPVVEEKIKVINHRLDDLERTR